jgi:hypothetical protein
VRVYIHGSEGRPPPASHTKYIAPAAHMAGQECPVDWVDSTGKPREFQIDFLNGTAEVEPTIGKYLIDTKQAERSRLILPGYFS